MADIDHACQWLAEQIADHSHLPANEAAAAILNSCEVRADTSRVYMQDDNGNETILTTVREIVITATETVDG